MRTFRLSRLNALGGLPAAIILGARDTGPSRAQPLYRSEGGRRAVLDLYERKLSALGFPHRKKP